MLSFAAIGRLVLSPGRFVQETISELKLVTWPTRRQTIQSTLIVVLLSVFVGLCIGGFDFVYVKAFGLLFK